MRRSVVAVALTLVTVPMLLVADTVGTLNSFTDGEVASAAEINANFAELRRAIDDNAAAIGGGTALGTVGNPAPSCKAIDDAGDSQGDGPYYLDPDGGTVGNAFQATCLMDSHGGGWTLCGKTTREGAYGTALSSTNNQGGQLLVGASGSYGYFCDKISHSAAMGYARISGANSFSPSLTGTLIGISGTISTVGNSTNRVSVGNANNSNCPAIVDGGFDVGGGCANITADLMEVRLSGTTHRNQTCNSSPGAGLLRSINNNGCADDAALQEFGIYVR